MTSTFPRGPFIAGGFAQVGAIVVVMLRAGRMVAIDRADYLAFPSFWLKKSIAINAAIVTAIDTAVPRIS